MLLDTHALLWWLADDRRLSRQARSVIDSSDLLVSVVSLWEIEIKRAQRRLEADTERILDRVSRVDGLAVLDVRSSHVVSLAELPLLHGDPFDRMLVAQARSEGAALVSRDRTLSGYDIDVYW